MNWYDNCLELVSFIGRDKVTRSSLENTKHGYFKDKLNNYIRYKIISTTKKPNSEEEFFKLTNIGLKLLRQEIRIEDVLNEEGN